MSERLARLRGWTAMHRRSVIGGGVAALVAVVAVVVAAVVVLGGDGGEVDQGGGVTPPSDVTISPAGEDVDRLAPVIVAFADAQDPDDPAGLVAVEPAVEGAYAWLDERTLLFQPEYPGYARGISYTVSVSARAAGVDAVVEQRFTVGGKLEVVNVIPADGDAEVPAAVQVLVQFTRSVAPLTILDAQSDAPVIEFDPPLAGTGEWLNTSLYRFIPSDLRPATTYSARVAAGLTSVDDGVLDADYEWSFTTYQPALATVDPADNTQFVGRNRPITLTFNQPMERAAVEAGVRLLGPGDEEVAGSFAWSEGDTVATFTADAPLALSSDYTIVVDGGLPGASGGETPSERRATFRTVDPPAVIHSEPSDGSQSAARWGVRIVFNNPMDIDSVEERLTVSGIDLETAFIDWYGDDRELYVQTTLEPSTDYEVRIADGAVDRDGLALGAYTLRFRTGQLTPSVTFAIPAQLATFTADSEPTLYFHATNVDEADFALYRLSSAQAEQIIEQGYLPSGPNGQPWTPSGAPIRNWSEPVEGSTNSVVLGSTSLSGDGEPLPRGHYYVLSRQGPGWNSQLLFSVVDSSLVTKLSWDELLVWALDYATGEPLANTTLRVEGPGFPSGTTATTDAQGLASIDVPRPQDIDPSESREYTVYAERNGRFGVASTRWSQGAEPWLLSVPVEYYPRSAVAHLYTDRPIYRPGESVFYKGVIRLDDDAAYSLPEPGTAYELIVRDPQYNELSRLDVRTSEFGTIDGEIELPADASTGYYSFELRLPSPDPYGGDWITGTSFQVAEFRRPEFAVEVAADNSDYVDGETIEAETLASYYFGGGVPDADVQWSVLSSPTSISAEGYERYSFRDYDFYREAEFLDPLRASGETTTDAQGRAQFSVAAAIRGNEGPQRYELSVTVLDASAQAVGGSTSVTVHPAEFYAGIATEEYIATAGKPTTIQLVSVDTDGVPVPDRAVQVEVYEREWITTKEQASDGSRLYRSEPRDTLLTTLDAATDGNGEAGIEYTPESAGSLRLVSVIEDDAGRVSRSATYLWVTGSNYVPWRVRNDDVIELVADKDEYQIGDVAEVLVPAPFAGAIGLVTVERGKIIERSTQVFETNSEVLRIPIEAVHVPDAYVSVVLYRPPTAEDPLPRYHVGYVQLPVSVESQHLDVSVTPAVDRAGAGDTVRYDIQVNDHEGNGVRADVSLAIVDQAVLALAAEVGPDGLGAFWFSRGLGVRTASSLAVSVDRTNDVISSPDFGGKGGGAERLRQDFRNTAFWEASIVTDDDGSASVDVPLPDNLTTWRAQARAVTGDTQVGEATSELLVTQPLLIRPALPRFLRVGDDAMLRAIVNNNTLADAEVTLTMEASGVDLQGEPSQTQRIARDSSAVFAWPAHASSEGEATVTLRATGGDEGDAVEITLPVYLDVTPETTATGGVVTGDIRVEAVYLPDFAIREGGSLELGVQGSLVGGLDDELYELRPLPYETYERVTSRLIATLAVARARGDASNDARIDADIATLVAGQRGDGGWGWCSRCRTDPRITAWVVLALADAYDDGRGVDPFVVARGRTVLRLEINRTTDVEHPANPDDRAFLLYALARAQSLADEGSEAGPEGGSVNSTTVAGMLRAHFEQERASLGNWGRASLLLGLRAVGAAPGSAEERALFNDLSAAAIPSANGSHWEDEPVRGSLRSNTRITALALEAIVEVEPDHPLIEESVRWLNVARSARRWETTIERAQSIVALSDYAAQTGELQGDFEYSVLVRDDEVLAGRFTPEDAGDSESTTVDLTELPAGAVSAVTFRRPSGGSGRLYYGLNLRYLTPATEIEALNRGFAVSHRYSLLDDPGRAVSSAPLGEVVRVTMTIVAPHDRNYVVVEDFLPAGLEPIDPVLNIVPADLRAQLREEQSEAFLGDAPPYFAPWFAWYYNPWDHVDTRDDRMTLFAAELPAGVYEYVYFARATSPGDYFVAPAHAEETYFPEVFGRSDSGRFRVEDAN